MKKLFIAWVIGTLLLWSGDAHSDPGDSPVLGRTSILRLGFGFPGGVASGMAVTMASNFSIYDSSAWLVKRGSGIQQDRFVTLSGDGARTSDQIGSNGTDFPLRVGWLNSLGKNQGWEFAIHLGVVHQIPPEVEMTAAGRIVLNRPSAETLRGSEKQLEEQLGNFDYYPVLSFGLRYRF